MPKAGPREEGLTKRVLKKKRPANGSLNDPTCLRGEGGRSDVPIGGKTGVLRGRARDKEAIGGKGGNGEPQRRGYGFHCQRSSGLPSRQRVQKGFGKGFSKDVGYLKKSARPWEKRKEREKDVSLREKPGSRGCETEEEEKLLSWKGGGPRGNSEAQHGKKEKTSFLHGKETLSEMGDKSMAQIF